jgi:hypothetical protein
MSPADLATLSLLDPDQGVCPNGDQCALDHMVGRRACGTCGYLGMALICWGITSDAVNRAVRAGADPLVVCAARSFLADNFV